MMTSLIEGPQSTLLHFYILLATRRPLTWVKSRGPESNHLLAITLSKRGNIWMVIWKQIDTNLENGHAQIRLQTHSTKPALVGVYSSL